jgi:hypothetical protein
VDNEDDNEAQRRARPDLDDEDDFSSSSSLRNEDDNKAQRRAYRDLDDEDDYWP